MRSRCWWWWRGVGRLGDGDSSENIPACLIVLTELGQKHFSSYSSALQLSFRRPRQSWSAPAAMRGVPPVFRHSASWLMWLVSASAGSGRRFTVTDGVWGLQSSNNKRNENRPNAASPCAASLDDINKWSFSQKHIVFVWRDFFSPSSLYYHECSGAPDSLCFSQQSRKNENHNTKDCKEGKKVAGALINHGDNLYTVLWPITASLEQEFHLDLPWLATRSTVTSVNSAIKCAVGCFKRVLSGATKEMSQEINDIELWDNKCETFTWVQLRPRRGCSLHHKAKKNVRSWRLFGWITCSLLTGDAHYF